MFKISNLFALFVFCGFVITVVVAQDPPKTPKAPFEAFEFFADGGSYLGVQTQEVTKENFGKFGLSGVRGVAVEKVLDDSPAKQAGLQDGDVIVRFNGEEVTSYRKLTRLISETAPDHQAKLTVVRGGSEREMTVTLGKRPAPKFEMGNFEIATPGVRVGEIPTERMNDFFVWEGGKDGNFVWGSTRQIGVGVSSFTKQLGEYFGVSDGKGILINNVTENSPAAKAGLKAGDVIVEVEGKAVNSTMELIRGIAEKKEGEVTLTILRNRNRQTVKVTPEKMKEGEMPFRISQPGGGAVRFTPGVRLNSFPRVPVASPSRTIAPARLRTMTRVL